MSCYNSRPRHKFQSHFLNTTPWINDQLTATAVPAVVMDRLLAAGWRHFGSDFFRYSIQFADGGEAQTIQPLRVDLARFRFSTSQRRVLNRNHDIVWEIIPARADEEVQALFHKHKQRFKDNVPESIFNFISAETPATLPCECLEFRALLDGRLIAVSFLALGQAASSSIYAVFDPAHSRRSLGTLTQLKEIEHGISRGCRYLYPGYATWEPSLYDYKKQLGALQYLDWHSGEWCDLRDSSAPLPPHIHPHQHLSSHRETTPPHASA